MSVVTSRYARAFADVILASKLDSAAVLQQLRALAGILEQSIELRRVWENPAIPAEQKRRVLDGIAACESLARPVRNFAAVLIDHRRIASLVEIARQVESELNQRMGLAEAEVTSARELDGGERRALEMQIEKVTGRKVRARYATDRNILGGAIVRVGSTIYDGSVRGQLHRMKEQLAAE
jgi:F-type H+-transporting ATPase subunit delta